MALILSSCGGEARETFSFGGGGQEGAFVSEDGRITVVEPGEREPSPRIVGRDLLGAPVDTRQWRGQVVVVNVWGSWCPPCRREAPALDQVARETTSLGVQFLGIAVREDAAASRAFEKRMGTSYPSISDPSGRQLLGFPDTLPAVAVPTTYVIDRDGRVAVRVLDELTEATLRGLVDDVLAEES